MQADEKRWKLSTARRSQMTTELAGMLGLGLLLAVPVAASPAPPAGSDSAEAKPPVLTGRWKLDPEKSDDARAKMREATGEERQGGSGGQGGSHGGGGHGGGHWGGGGGGGHWGGHGGGYRGGQPANRPSEEERAAMRDVIDDVMQPADVLTITQGEKEVTIARDDGRSVRLFPDGRKNDESGKSVERKTKWDGPQLVSETKVGSGPVITESWSLSADGQRLQSSVHVKMPRSEREVVINRLYQSAPPQ
jgi:hypothetical protein